MSRKPQNKFRTTPHCPKCLIRMFYNNSEYSEYRCGKCGRKYVSTVVGSAVGYPKYGLVEIGGVA